jgi:GNAT superfamily N-acetyltransferase
MTIRLRRAAAADAQAVRQLTREAYAKWIPVIGREPRPMSADYDAALRKHRIDLLYVDDVLAAIIETANEADHLLIVNVAVSPGFQGSGLGHRLMAHAEDLAALAGLPQLRLYTNQRFAENIRLYASLGYGVDREEAISDGVVVHMSKPCPAGPER